MAGIDCGSQCILCDLPIRIDTYIGCSHACKYCFAQRNADITKLEISNCLNALKAFIDGKRSGTTNWCDWDIPLHWGGMSDPFQPIESKYKISYQALKIFAETKYPFVVSTKGKLLATDEYLKILKQCNAVVQISMVCNKYDKIETGAPTFEERLEMCRKIAPNCKRLNIRIQPYLPEVIEDVLQNIPKFADAGVYGLTVEGMKFVHKMKNTVKLGADYVIKKEILQRDFQRIKDKCHEYGLKFYCGENRLRNMGDNMTCCGVDGLDGFIPNTFNLCHIYNGEKVKPTEKMKKIGTAHCYHALDQGTGNSAFLRDKSYYGMTCYYVSKNKRRDSFE